MLVIVIRRNFDTEKDPDISIDDIYQSLNGFYHKFGLSYRDNMI